MIKRNSSVLCLIMLLFFSGCTKGGLEPAPAAPLSADAPASVYGQDMEAFNVGTLDQEKNTYMSEYIQVDSSLSSRTTLSYVETTTGKYTGNMKIDLKKSSASSSRYVLNIPKSFAQTADDLIFSTTPDNIIKQDPVVAWNLDKDISIDIKTKKEYTADEVKQKLPYEAFSYQMMACEKIETFEESTVCEWRLIEKYKDAPFMKDILAEMPLSTAEGASVRALLDGKFDMCFKYIDGSASDDCVQTVFRAKEFQCRSSPDAKGCIRKIMWPLGLSNIRNLCNFISLDVMKKECRGDVLPDVCNELSAVEKSKCLTNIARFSNNIKDCDRIASVEAKDNCRAMLGVDNSNQDLCMQISDADIKDECISKVAMQTKDKELCIKIANENARSLCQVYIMSSEGKIDKAICDKMPSGEEGWIKDACLGCYAVSIKDMDACKEIMDPDTEKMCRMTVGLVLEDPGICEAFDESDKDVCYNLFGLLLDKKYCEKVVSEEMKTDCKKAPLPGKVEDTYAPVINTSVSGPCPVNPPSDAHKYDQESQSGGWMIRYSMQTGVTVGQELYYYDKAKTKIASSKCYDEKGQQHGPFAIFNMDGTQSQEGNYKNGKMDGVSRSWSQGTLDTVATYVDGKTVGPYTRYITEKGAANGKILYTGTYNGYKKEGDWKYYNGVTGALEEETSYDNDCIVSQIKYYEDGTKESEKAGKCENNKFTGTSITYARGQQGKTTCQVVNDELTKCV